jgi:hypothetical protein
VDSEGTGKCIKNGEDHGKAEITSHVILNLAYLRKVNAKTTVAHSALLMLRQWGKLSKPYRLCRSLGVHPL